MVKVNRLLNEVPTATAISHTADDFATHFRDKVGRIRQSALVAPVAVVEPRSTLVAPVAMVEPRSALVAPVAVVELRSTLVAPVAVVEPRSALVAPVAVVEPRSAGTLSTFRPVTTAEITKIIMNSPAKHCCLDPAPTWLVKQLCHLLAPSIAEMCNASVLQGILPENQKHAVVRPRLKNHHSIPTT